MSATERGGDEASWERRDGPSREEEREGARREREREEGREAKGSGRWGALAGKGDDDTPWQIAVRLDADPMSDCPHPSPAQPSPSP